MQRNSDELDAVRVHKLTMMCYALTAIILVCCLIRLVKDSEHAIEVMAGLCRFDLQESAPLLRRLT